MRCPICITITSSLGIDVAIEVQGQKLLLTNACARVGLQGRRPDLLGEQSVLRNLQSRLWLSLVFSKATLGGQSMTLFDRASDKERFVEDYATFSSLDVRVLDRTFGTSTTPSPLQQAGWRRRHTSTQFKGERKHALFLFLSKIALSRCQAPALIRNNSE